MDDYVKIVKQYHQPTHKGPEFEYELLQVVVPKKKSKVDFGVYMYQVDAFIADEFL